MNDETKRIFLFVFGCMTTRLFLVWLAMKYQNILPIMGIFALIIAASWITLYITGWRQTGSETFGQKIYWNNFRPIHALLYILFAVYALQKQPYAWKVLLIDAILGATIFISHHFIPGTSFHSEVFR